MKMMSTNPVAKVMGSASPFAGRTMQFSDAEDSTERVTNVVLNPDGSMSLVADSTNPVEVIGNWKMGVSRLMMMWIMMMMIMTRIL